MEEVTNQPIKVTKRRHFLLIEVLIAFAFVVIGILPLIYPHFFIYQQQHKFIEKINTDIAVNEFYAIILEQLQQNQISWGTIELKQPIPITNDFWARSPQYTTPPFTGSYQFQIIKGKKNDQYGLYRVGLTITIPPKTFKNEAEKAKNTLTYTYEVFITRLFSAA